MRTARTRRDSSPVNGRPSWRRAGGVRLDPAHRHTSLSAMPWFDWFASPTECWGRKDRPPSSRQGNLHITTQAWDSARATD